MVQACRVDNHHEFIRRWGCRAGLGVAQNAMRDHPDLRKEVASHCHFRLLRRRRGGRASVHYVRRAYGSSSSAPLACRHSTPAAARTPALPAWQGHCAAGSCR
eukprot:109094-Alexandrium_andersonii.AAC.1